MVIVNLIAIILLTIIVIICAKKKAEYSGVFCKSIDKELYRRVAFFAILVFAILIRIINLDKLPVGINQDGAMAAVDAKALATYGTDRFGTLLPAHLYAWGFGQMSSLLSYFMVPFIKLFGFSVWTMRMPIVVVSMGGIVAMYFIGKKLFSDKLALIAMALTAINPWHLLQSRWALDCNMFPHMFIIGFALMLYGLEKKRYLYISMLFFGLSMYGYGVSFYMVPVFLIAFVIVSGIKKKISAKDIIICILIYLFVSWPEYMVMIVNFFKMPTIKLPFVTIQYFSECTRISDMLPFSDNFWPQLESNLRHLINMTFNQGNDALWNSMEDFSTMYKCSIPLMITGLIAILRRKDKNIYRTILLIYFYSSIFLGLMINNVNVNRMNVIYYALILFVVYAIEYIAKKSNGLSIFTTAIYGLFGIIFISTYFSSFNKMLGNTFYRDFIEASEYARDKNCDYYRITPDTQMTGAYRVTDILTEFVFDIDCKYKQGEYDEWDGKNIPYEERFTYGNPYNYSDFGNEGDISVAYIIKATDAYVFDEDIYDITIFGRYASVIKE